MLCLLHLKQFYQTKELLHMHEQLPIRCLVIDDEPPAREIIKQYSTVKPMLQLTGECGTANQAISFLQQP